MTDLVATCARGTEDVLTTELLRLGGENVRAENAAVTFSGTLSTAYRACLWSRIASRILLPLATFEAPDADALYAGVYAIPWHDHLGPEHTFAVRSVVAGTSPFHSRFAALKTKDALVDRIRDIRGTRPNVDTTQPDLHVHVLLAGTTTTVGLNLSGEPLHRRGYRSSRGEAPLKENLAAAILQLLDWETHASAGLPLVDPMCGTGTLLIEGAWIAGDVAPGLLRGHFGFERWYGHDARTWSALVEEARERLAQGATRIPPLHGADASDEALGVARDNARRANVHRHIRFERNTLANAASPGPSGILITNPPYGERLGDPNELLPLYEQLGDVLKHRFPSWRAGVFTGNPVLARAIGLRSSKRHVLFNGPIECRLLDFTISNAPVEGSAGPRWRRPSTDADMFRNRLAKNLRRLRTWARNERIDCFRAYDADIPEYNVAIDIYGDSVHVQEYERPRHIDREVAERHIRDVMLVVPEVAGASSENVFLKVRRRHTTGQYTRMQSPDALQQVRENDHQFLVNLGAYLDTGLFLDHRLVRRLVGRMASQKRFLNLFAYTCTATVYAAKQGCVSSTSVDLSNNYLDWAAQNFRLNDIDLERHKLVRSDCLTWLERERSKYDVVFVAPPTQSKSKQMRDAFDVRSDHPSLLDKIARLLSPAGAIVFSTHARGFELDASLKASFDVEDVTARTTPRDFERARTLPRTYVLRAR